MLKLNTYEYFCIFQVKGQSNTDNHITIYYLDKPDHEKIIEEVINRVAPHIRHIGEEKLFRQASNLGNILVYKKNDSRYYLFYKGLELSKGLKQFFDARFSKLVKELSIGGDNNKVTLILLDWLVSQIEIELIEDSDFPVLMGSTNVKEYRSLLNLLHNDELSVDVLQEQVKELVKQVYNSDVHFVEKLFILYNFSVLAFYKRRFTVSLTLLALLEKFNQVTARFRGMIYLLKAVAFEGLTEYQLAFQELGHASTVIQKGSVLEMSMNRILIELKFYEYKYYEAFQLLQEKLTGLAPQQKSALELSRMYFLQGDIFRGIKDLRKSISSYSLGLDLVLFTQKEYAQGIHLLFQNELFEIFLDAVDSSTVLVSENLYREGMINLANMVLLLYTINPNWSEQSLARILTRLVILKEAMSFHDEKNECVKEFKEFVDSVLAYVKVLFDKDENRYEVERIVNNMLKLASKIVGLDITFLLVYHMDGRLIYSWTKYEELMPEGKVNLFGSAIQAIQAVLKESISTGEIKEIKLGNKWLLLDSTRDIVLSVLTSSDPNRMKVFINSLLKGLEAIIGDSLEMWFGDHESIKPLKEFLDQKLQNINEGLT